MERTRKPRNNYPNPQDLNMDRVRVALVYMLNTANPFIPSGGSRLWRRNELIMHDALLRAKSGVSQLDQDITEVYSVNPTKSKY